MQFHVIPAKEEIINFSHARTHSYKATESKIFPDDSSKLLQCY
jgi:hypothetical protein